jgi:C-terminal processing protease CtpA/Prc
MSGAEFHTMIVKAMPNGAVIGEKTNGSASNTVDSLTYNGGAFNLGPIVSRVAGSVVQYRCADGNIYEGFGILPDIDIPMSRSDWENFFGGTKTDKRLAEAIRYIDPAAALP